MLGTKLTPEEPRPGSPQLYSAPKIEAQDKGPELLGKERLGCSFRGP